MPFQRDDADWDFSSAIELLKSLSLSNNKPIPAPPETPPSLPHPEQALVINNTSSHLGDFSSLWSLFGGSLNEVVAEAPVSELEGENTSKGVRWRDELDGADLEDNVEPAPIDSAASLRTQKRAARRARARMGVEKHASTSAIKKGTTSDTGTDAESGEELDRLRRSPDRRAVIQNILGRHGPYARDNTSPPTSPSPPKSDLRPIKRDWPISTPFLWQADDFRSSPSKNQIAPRDELSPAARKAHLISMLAKDFRAETKYLTNSGLMEPAFTPLNVSTIGIHVFIDISNVSTACSMYSKLMLTR